MVNGSSTDETELEVEDDIWAVVSLIAGILGWLVLVVDLIFLTRSISGISIDEQVLTWLMFCTLLMVPLSPLIAVLTGHLGKNRIRKSQGGLRGSGKATAGLILGYSGLVIGIGIYAYSFMVMSV